MKPNTAVITLKRLKELEAYEEAINKRETLTLQSDCITRETKLYISDELAKEKVHEFCLEKDKKVVRLKEERIGLECKIKRLEEERNDLKYKLRELEEKRVDLECKITRLKEENKYIFEYSDSELEEEVLKRLKNFNIFSGFHKLSVYFREGFIDKHMITTLSVWEFLRWKKRKKKESISFKLP